MRGKIATGIAASLIVATGLFAATAADAYPRPGRLLRVDLPRDDSDGRLVCRIATGCGPTDGMISSDGRSVAFQSDADNLVAGDRNLGMDVFRRDLRSKTIRRVSVANDGAEAVGVPDLGSTFLSSEPSISATGRFVSFTSHAINLVEGDTNLRPDIFVHDLHHRRTTRVSVDSRGRQAAFEPGLIPNFGSHESSISDDGRYVAFATFATNLGGLRCDPDCGGGPWIYRHDRTTGKTSLASRDLAGAPVGGSQASISGNGRYVVFKMGSDVFRRDMKAGRTQIVSAPQEGDPIYPAFSVPNGSRTNHRYGRAISADGRFVSFASHAVNLVPNDTNLLLPAFSPAGEDSFVKDMKTGRVERISVSSFGEEATTTIIPNTNNVNISGDGRYVVFSSYAEPLAEPSARLYVHDRLTGATAPAALTNDGRPPDGSYIGYASISRRGRRIEFISAAPNFGDGQEHVFVYDRGGDAGSGEVIRASDPVGDVAGSRTTVSGDVVADAPRLVLSNADLVGASVAYRPDLHDLSVRLDVSHMSRAGLDRYEVTFLAGSRTFAVTAMWDPIDSGRGRFELLDCGLASSPASACTRVATLRGGMGTIGHSVIVSVPLDEIGLENGLELRNITARTTTAGGMVELDRMAF